MPVQVILWICIAITLSEYTILTIDSVKTVTY